LKPRWNISNLSHRYQPLASEKYPLKLHISTARISRFDLAQRSQTLRLRSSQLTDPTITGVSLVDQGIETVFGVIYPPLVTIVEAVS
jgi:hypothetical protein